jgi:fucose 4-O-acetylase-like acetyltransferase
LKIGGEKMQEKTTNSLDKSEESQMLLASKQASNDDELTFGDIFERNEILDTLRGFTIMYVIFVHCLYWLGLFNGNYSSVIKSFFLIEMPLFFFITGASNSLSKKRTIIDFYLSRFQRVLLPYWIYCVLCIILTIIIQKIIPFEQDEYFSISLPTVFQPVSKVAYLTGTLWFVPVYLYVILLFPLLKWYYERHENDNKKYIPLIVFPIMLANNGWEMIYDARMVLFYGFWMYSGMFFQKLDMYESIKNKRKIIPIISGCALLVVWFVQKNIAYANMQTNKFPPNIVFMIYTLGGLLTFYLLSRHILNFISILRKNQLFNWIYEQYIESAYTIYLYHPLSFLSILIVLEKTPTVKGYLYNNQWLCFFVYMVLTIPMCAVLGRLFSWGERIKIKHW